MVVSTGMVYGHPMPAAEMLFSVNVHLQFIVLVLTGAERYCSNHATEMLLNLGFHFVFGVLVLPVAG
jgi:hypothetical protein